MSLSHISFLPNDFGFDIFLVAGGCLFVVVEFVQMFRSVAAARWPSVVGEIEAAGVEQGRNFIDSTGHVQTAYQPIVRYRYQLADGVHYGDRLGFGGLVHTSISAAKRVAGRYRKQEVVKVYVSPTKPTLAVIEVGVRWEYLLDLAIGVILIVTGTTMLHLLSAVGT
ncbi:MAG: DUF3592 domain-containing protein [Acidihalobacter sp.]